MKLIKEGLVLNNTKVFVGRHKDGITLNELEYILTPDGTAAMVFKSEQAARNFLTENGVLPENLDSFVYKPVEDEV